jgi:D-alanine transaminase/branched-chain amino acid aminotransferase
MLLFTFRAGIKIKLFLKKQAAGTKANKHLETFKIMTETYSIINTDLVIKNKASILISDLSIQRGYGIFDFFRTINNKPVFLEDHLDRFFYSASQMQLEQYLNRTQIKQLIHQLIEKNNISDSGIRITLTGGYSEDGYSLTKPNLLITQSAFTFNTEIFNKGIKLITFNHQRQLPSVKTIDYLIAIHLQPFIKSHNADDLLYYHHNEITECPRSNFFMVTQKDEVVTPSKNILKGITRKKILGFAELHVRETTVRLEDIKTAKEAFITSTTKNVLPVFEIDGKTIGDGKPGRITSEIYKMVCKMKEGKVIA